MRKTLIRLTESDIHRIVKESVNRILKEHTIVEEGADGMDALAEYKAAIEQHKNVLRRMIPNLPFYSPEQRAEIEAEMAKYGINPRG